MSESIRNLLLPNFIAQTSSSLFRTKSKPARIKQKTPVRPRLLSCIQTVKMLLKTLLPSFLAAATVKGFPAPDLDEALGELQVFKRDAVLDARDLELAELHNVNLTESKACQSSRLTHDANCFL